MTSFTRASRASAGRARGLRARLSSFSAVRGPVGLLYAPNVRGTAWATGFLSWRRGNVTLTQSRARDPPRLFHILSLSSTRSIEIDMKSSRVVVTARGAFHAQCRVHATPRPAAAGVGVTGVAYACAYTRRYPRRVTYFPAALPGVRYGLWYCGRIPRSGGERRDPHGRRFQVRFQVRFPKKWIRFFFPFGRNDR